jgi:H+/Cl- antiporter ClcA
MKIAEWKKAATWMPSPIVQVLIVALLTALVNYPNMYMRAQSSELVYSLFAECSQVLDDQFGLCETGAASAATIVLLLFAGVVGFFLASITFGLQIPAGIILPSMAIGALFGPLASLWRSGSTTTLSFTPFRIANPTYLVSRPVHTPSSAQRQLSAELLA